MSRLETWRPQIEALARFNDVPELGGPLGADLPERFWELLASVRTCGTSEDQVSLEDAPFCRECLLPLDENVPLREATLLLSETKGAMRVSTAGSVPRLSAVSSTTRPRSSWTSSLV